MGIHYSQLSVDERNQIHRCSNEERSSSRSLPCCWTGFAPWWPRAGHWSRLRADCAGWTLKILPCAARTRGQEMARHEILAKRVKIEVPES